MEIVEATRRSKVAETAASRSSARPRLPSTSGCAGPVLFFRGTYYRWGAALAESTARSWPRPGSSRGRRSPHRDFGTWRDGEGRLVWGVNDFDKAHPMAFPNDLVRLAVSALSPPNRRPISSQAARGLRQNRRRFTARGERGGSRLFWMESHPSCADGAPGFASARPFLATSRSQSAPLRGASPIPPARRSRKYSRMGPSRNTASQTPERPGSLGHRATWRWFDWQGAGWRGRPNRSWLGVPLGEGERAARREGNPWLERTVRSAVRCADPTTKCGGAGSCGGSGPIAAAIDIDETPPHEGYGVFSLPWAGRRQHPSRHAKGPQRHSRGRGNHLVVGLARNAAHLMLQASAWQGTGSGSGPS